MVYRNKGKAITVEERNSIYCFSKVVADRFSLLHCVHTKQNAAEKQAEKTSAFTQVIVLTLID